MKQTCLYLARVSGTQTNPLVVGKYAHTRQMRLRGKVVKNWSRQALEEDLCRALKNDRKNRGCCEVRKKKKKKKKKIIQ